MSNHSSGEVVVRNRTHSGGAAINSLFNHERDLMIIDYTDVNGRHPFRQNSIKYIRQRHWHFRFSPRTAYRALYYFDWFMTRHTASDEGWYRLLAVTCLFVAVGEEDLPDETRPSLEELQGHPARFSILRVWNAMGTVTGRLQQNLGCVTPVDFFHYLISRLPPSVPRSSFHIAVNFNFLLMKGIQAEDYMRYVPSELAAAAVILAAGQRDVELPDSFYERLDRARVASLSQQWEGFVPVSCNCLECVPTQVQVLPARLVRFLGPTVPNTGDEDSGTGENDMPEGPVSSGDNLRNPDPSPVVNLDPTVSTTRDESSGSGEAAMAEGKVGSEDNIFRLEME